GGLGGCLGILMMLGGAYLYSINPLFVYVPGGLFALLAAGAVVGGRWSAIGAIVAAAGLTITIAAGWRSALACLIASAAWTVALVLTKNFLLKRTEGFGPALVKNGL